MQSIAFVTGADRGLGFALCKELLARGWRVFAGQYMPDWPDLADLKSHHPTALHIVPLDVGSTESVQAAAQAVAAQTDAVAVQTAHIDMLINNAGVATKTSRRDIHEPQDYDEMHRLYNVNSLGPLRVVEAFLPLLDRSTLKRRTSRSRSNPCARMPL